MESTKPQPASSFSSLTRTVTKILRFRRAAAGSGRGFDNQKLKPTYSEFSSGVSDSKEKQQQLENPCSNSSTSRREVDIESLLGSIFAGVSAIKAAYSQLQVAESPYDPDTIQSSDEAVVSELKRLSELKQSYLKQQKLETKPLQQKQNTPILTAQLQEQRNLLKTYQITTMKLESGLRHKDAEIDSLHAQFLNSERYNRSLESRLRLLSSLDNLHPADLNPMHFLAELRLAVKSVRTFVKQMTREMESAGWDLDAAATVIQPDVRGKPDHWIHAFESFVCRRMFSDFGRGSSSWDARRFFREFVAMRSAKPEEGAGAGEMGVFIREKYLELVHPKMEASFISNLNRKGGNRSVRSFAESEFCALFTEMARRVWLLRCLYCSYGPETEAMMIFQAKRGARFSDVYMESVVSPVASPAAFTVAFTVVPGFRVGNTLIQCKVYVSSM